MTEEALFFKYSKCINKTRKRKKNILGIPTNLPIDSGYHYINLTYDILNELQNLLESPK